MTEFDNQGSNLIFILSLPRSGSTLLQRILGAHSGVHTVAEPWLMLNPLYALRHHGAEAEYDAALARQGLDDFLNQFEDGRAVYIESVRQWASVLYGAALTQSGKTRFLDKTPRYYHILPELREVFPKAKFVFLLRNPAAILSSVLKTWFDNQPAALEGTSNFLDLTVGAECMARGLESFGDQAVQLRYEELVLDPQATITRLCAEIDLPFEASMLEYGSAPQPVGRHGDQVGIPRHSHAVPDYLGIWKDNLLAPDRNRFARDYLLRLGPECIARLGYDFEDIDAHLRGASINIPSDAGSWPTPADTINAEGEALFAQGDLDGAQARFDKALLVDPDYVLAHNNLAVLHWQRGAAEHAVAEIANGLLKQPRNRDLVINGGQILAALGETENSATIYQSYLAHFPEDREVAHLLHTLTEPKQSIAPIASAVGESAATVEDLVTRDDPMSGGDRIPIITSIAPRGLDKQKRAIRSWQELGFEVLSLNTQKEIDRLKEEFPGVNFIKATRDGSGITGKPHVYIDDMLAALRKTGRGTVGIVNSDIILRAQPGLTDYLNQEACGSFLYASRIDIDQPEDTAGKVYHRGFDVFFFDRSVIEKIPATNFMLGMPWWDYWIPLAPLLSGVPVKRIDTPLGYHVWHATNYSDEHLVYFAREFGKYCQEAPFIDFYRQCVDGGYGNVRYSVLSDAALDHLARNSARVNLPASATGNLRQHARNNGMRVTAIVSTYNSEAFIADCLSDLVGQTIANEMEIIVIDAASPQNERAVVERFQRQHANIRYHRTPHRIGIYAAWNLAARMARGDYLITCSTNDRLRNDACEILARTLDERPDVALAYGNSFLTTQPHESFERHTICGLYVWPDYSYELLTDRCMVGPHPMWRRSVHEAVGYFNENIVALGDQEFWLRLGQDFQLLNLPDFTGLYYVSETSITGDTDLTRIETDQIHSEYRWRYRYKQWLSRRSTRNSDAQQHRNGPLTQIVVIGRHSDGQQLANTLDSVAGQLFNNWHMTVVSNDVCPDALFEFEPQLDWVQCSDSEALGQILDRVTGQCQPEWVSVVDAGEVLDPAFLSDCHRYLRKNPEWKFVYCDDDRMDGNGDRLDPRFKPDWNLELLRGTDYIGNAFVASFQAIVKTGGFGTRDYALSFDLALRIHDQFGARSIGHVAEMRFHRNVTTNDQNIEAIRALERRQVLEQHLERCGEVAQVEEGILAGTLMPKYSIHEWPSVSVLILATAHGEHLETCVHSVLDKTDYPALEVRILDNTGENDNAKQLLARLAVVDTRVKVIESSTQDVCEDLNRLAESATGAYLLWLKEDAVVIQTNWLRQLVRQGLRPSVGAVGARIVNRKKALVSGGILLGIGSRGVGGRCHEGIHVSSPGYMGRAQVAQEIGAVPGLCMLVRKSLFAEVGGYDQRFSVDLYRDVDFSLRVAKEKKAIIWTPFSTILYLGKPSYVDGRVDDEKLLERQISGFQERWLAVIAGDRAYNRHLSASRSDFALEIDTVCGWDPVIDEKPRVLSFGVGSYGSWQYRVKQPLDALDKMNICQRTHTPFVGRKRIVLPSVVTLERLKPDVLLMHNTMHDEFIDAMARYKRVNQTFIVFGQDDLMTALPPKNPFAKTIYRDMKQRVRKCLALADRLIVTTEPLADALSGFADDISIVPNYLDAAVWGGLVLPDHRDGKPRVGWAGAQQHLGDLGLLDEVVRETADEVDWIFFGMCPDTLRPFVREVHRPVKFEQYPAKLATLNLDLAIAPLEHNRFNECKSNLRILEYGILGWPVIASDITPYRNAPVHRVPNHPRAWTKAIREHVSDPGSCRKAGELLRDWVVKNWMLHDHLGEWQVALGAARECGECLTQRDGAVGL
ncbi:MAG: sulfotransferase [Thiogranum sp.]|nr:sulfotransferase [Thiogranum sp.]